MKFKPIQQIKVYLNLEGNERKLGTLAWSGRERRVYFEYAAEFLTAPPLISPFHMMAATGLIAAPRDPFDGSMGYSTTACLTGGVVCCWTAVYSERALIIPGSRRLTVSRRWAEREWGHSHTFRNCQTIRNNRPSLISIGSLIRWSWYRRRWTSPTSIVCRAHRADPGARPKIMIGFNKVENTCVLDYGQPLGAGFERWMVKAPGSDDPAGDWR